MDDPRPGRTPDPDESDHPLALVTRACDTATAALTAERPAARDVALALTGVVAALNTAREAGMDTDGRFRDLASRCQRISLTFVHPHRYSRRHAQASAALQDVAAATRRALDDQGHPR